MSRTIKLTQTDIAKVLAGAQSRFSTPVTKTLFDSLTIDFAMYISKEKKIDLREVYDELFSTIDEIVKNGGMYLKEEKKDGDSTLRGK